MASGIPPTLAAITGHAAQQSFQNDARARFGPQGRHQEHARAGEQEIDVVNRREDADVGPRLQRRAILLVGAPGGHGGELRLRKRIGQRQEDRDALLRRRD